MYFTFCDQQRTHFFFADELVLTYRRYEWARSGFITERLCRRERKYYPSQIEMDQ